MEEAVVITDVPNYALSHKVVAQSSNVCRLYKKFNARTRLNGPRAISWRFQNVMDWVICDARYMTKFENATDTILWRFFSDSWRKSVVMDHMIFFVVVEVQE